MATSQTPHDWREWRRLRAWHLKQRGWTQHDIADALDVSAAAVSQWLTGEPRRRRCVASAYLARTSGQIDGSRETSDSRVSLAWSGSVWFSWRRLDVYCVTYSSNGELGVAYHKDHVSRVLKELGWTPQIPNTRAVQRDEETIGDGGWRCGRNCDGKRPEMPDPGFYRRIGHLPAARRCAELYGPKGQTPVVDKRVDARTTFRSWPVSRWQGSRRRWFAKNRCRVRTVCIFPEDCSRKPGRGCW